MEIAPSPTIQVAGHSQVTDHEIGQIVHVRHLDDTRVIVAAFGPSQLRDGFNQIFQYFPEGGIPGVEFWLRRVNGEPCSLQDFFNDPRGWEIDARD